LGIRLLDSFCLFEEPLFDAGCDRSQPPSAAKTPRSDSLPYTVTKFSLQGMTHQLTMDGRKHNIVSSINPSGATLSSFSTRRGRTKARREARRRFDTAATKRNGPLHWVTIWMLKVIGDVTGDLPPCRSAFRQCQRHRQ
jgi:NAD(P)-dependent dehydrogenase (short-subunit alcohol dehydrogenase family)